MSRTIFNGRAGLMGMMRQHPEVVPVIGAVTFGCVLAGGYLGILMSRPDVVWDNKRENMPWLRVPQATNQHFSAFAKTTKADGTPLYTAHAADDLRYKL
eukprot:m.52272 g.52272  ORF g.52272 m.52272 type:complete len:99 (-) comp15399_c0_seq1:92-388(-)